VSAAGTADPSWKKPGSGCELREVSVAYHATPAVGPVSLRVPAGQSVALVGPSGAGKTTLLRVLAGQVAPTTGQVLVAGRDLAGLHGRRDRARTVGIMSQRLDLVPQLSVKHNVQAGVLGRWGLARSLAALLLPLEHPPAREAVARVGLEDHFGTRVADLSGGQAQRVALARLLVQDPKVLLADEPAASLDPARADDLLALLHQIARRNGHTVVTSLHDPDLARRHVDRVVGLREGKVLFDLPPDSVTDDMLQALYRLLSPVEPSTRPQAGGGW
jgi:phosphonate transport system ATP-binding protein